jgi:RNA polymerase sigma-70 factor (ECF subfamily)
MTETSEPNCEEAGGRDMTDRPEDLHVWFLREVFPLEAALTQFFRNNWRNRADVADLLQEVYVRVYEAAEKQLPKSVKPFVFMTARNLIVDRVRRDKIIPLDVVGDLDALDVAADAPGPESQSVARDELRQLQSALDQIPDRAREAFVLHHIQGLSRREIAIRMNVSCKTVDWHLKVGVQALADLIYGEPPTKRAKP